MRAKFGVPDVSTFFVIHVQNLVTILTRDIDRSP